MRTHTFDPLVVRWLVGALGRSRRLLRSKRWVVDHVCGLRRFQEGQQRVDRAMVNVYYNGHVVVVVWQSEPVDGFYRARPSFVNCRHALLAPWNLRHTVQGYGRNCRYELLRYD